MAADDREQDREAGSTGGGAAAVEVTAVAGDHQRHLIAKAGAEEAVAVVVVLEIAVELQLMRWVDRCSEMRWKTQLSLDL